MPMIERSIFEDAGLGFFDALVDLLDMRARVFMSLFADSDGR